MPPKSKSLFRQPGAQHFQLVHRSQRDPLIHDPDASQHVLKPFVRENEKKGKSRAELEQILTPADLAHDLQRANIGEAAIYGVYYDDTDYDYMQHLRQVGVQEDGVESVLIEAPSSSKAKGKGKAAVTLKDIPAEALPSTSELPRNYESQEAVPASIAGFQPDMDPHLRQVLEALEDDAFVDDGLEDDFFGELVKDGERTSGEAVEFEFAEEGVEDGELQDGAEEEGEEEDDSWEARFAAFKKQQKAEAPHDTASDVDGLSEGGDTVGHMPEFSVIGGKKRRKGTSDASGYSMSSSSMFRNAGLTLLDEQFDQVEKQYREDGDDDFPDDDEDDDDEAPQLITSRADFENMMDDFLQNYEILGGKLKPSLPGAGPAKLETLRLAMGRDPRVKQGSDESEDDDDEDIYKALEREDKRERWDVETVLTTHTNLENHPRLIRARESKPVPKIRLDPRTGLPIVVDKPAKVADTADDDSSSSSDEDTTSRTTVTRARDESKEDKKARKAAVKAEKQTRRVEKKAKKQQFSAAIKQQSQILATKDTKTRKL